MKLKEIPANTVVHTPTEAEAKELLAILYENGYKWCNGDSLIEDSDWEWHEKATCYFISSYVEVGTMPDYDGDGTTSLTLAEFKRLYYEEEKPQPKFKVGDIVRIINDCGCNAFGLIGVVDEIATRSISVTCGDIRLSCLYKWVEPYTEPETKDKAKEAKGETKEFNLCELLKGHEEEIFYHLMYGEVRYKGIDKYGLIAFTDSEIPTIYDDGKYDQDANVVLYPSRALYEQYPLDPYTAWMKWKEEQKIYSMSISYQKIIGAVHGCGGKTINNLTEKQCNKCIEEIKAIIEKYSKK